MGKLEQRDLYVSSQREQHRSDHLKQDQQGKLYRGSSWRYDEKLTKSVGGPTSSRYSRPK